jgi:hypothetical protein
MKIDATIARLASHFVTKFSGFSSHFFVENLGVNFTNILRAAFLRKTAFLHQSFARSLLVLTFKV